MGIRGLNILTDPQGGSMTDQQGGDPAVPDEEKTAAELAASGGTPAPDTRPPEERDEDDAGAELGEKPATDPVKEVEDHELDHLEEEGASDIDFTDEEGAAADDTVDNEEAEDDPAADEVREEASDGDDGEG
jgi:hypothetical protein